MDLYNFYRGLENVIDTLQKDRHDLTMKDYLVMCDPFFNVDFYDEKYLNRQIGGMLKVNDEEGNALKESLIEGNVSQKKDAAAAEAELKKKLKQKNKPLKKKQKKRQKKQKKPLAKKKTLEKK